MFKLQSRRYLGCKSKLIDFIHQIVKENCEDIGVFADIFGGTGVVGYSFANESNVIINDILESNIAAYYTFFSNQIYSKKKLIDIIDNYNSLTVTKENYYSKNFSNTYLSKTNMRKVGFIRDDIDNLFLIKKINLREKYILITSLLYAIDRIANTVGHYDAYRKEGDLSAKLELQFPDIQKLKYKAKIFKRDANELAKEIKPDLVYIDPPYNSRQYCDAYHFLENVACNQKPIVEGVARKMDRSNLKSKYCSRKAADELEDLINNLKTNYILLSYNNTGEKNNDRSNAKISDDDIMRILSKKGKVQVFEKDFNLYTTGKSEQENHKERLFLCTVGKEQNQEELIVKEVQSPLNYTGGKFKLLKQISSYFPNDINFFYDIFCGGCNVGANVKANKIICVDNNDKLISLLNYIKNNDYSDIMNEIESLISKYRLSDTYRNSYEFYGCESDTGVGKYNKPYFAKLKSDYNSSSNKPDVLFLLLIFYSFNNQIRFNNSGEFNLPVGKRDFNGSLRKKFRQFYINIHEKNIEFACKDFKDINITKLKQQNAFLYLDPPYLLGDASYNESGGWDDNKEIDLLNFLSSCNSDGIKFALSNVIEHKGKTNDILIKWANKNKFQVNYLDKKYNNSNYQIKNKNGVTKEVLITNYKV